MKHELLRLEHITKRSGGIKLLDDLSLMVLSGEHVQITGLSGSGMEEIGHILEGSACFDSGQIVFDGKTYRAGAPLPVDEMGIFSVFEESTIVPQMSVAENIFMLRPHRLFSPAPPKRLINSQTGELLAQFGLNIPPDALCMSLSRVEKMSIEFIKAYARNAKLIVAHGVAGPYPAAQERIFSGVRRKLIEEGVTVIAISASPHGIFDTYDRTVVMRDGDRSKTIYQQFRTREDIMRYAAAGDLPEPVQRQSHTENEYAFRSFNLSLGEVRHVSLHVRRGEVVGVYDPVSNDLREALERLLTGAEKPDSGYMLLGETEFAPMDLSQAVSLGLGYINGAGLDNQLVSHMSVLDNVMLPSLKKAPVFRFFRNRPAEREVRRLLESGMSFDAGVFAEALDPEDDLTRQVILYHRWGVYRPKLLLYSDPFAHSDAVVRLRLAENIEKLTALGVGVLALSPRLRDLVYFCDRILMYRDGSFVSEYRRDDDRFRDLPIP